MHMTGSAISLTVDDVPVSSQFLATYFGYAERMAADGFASLSHPDSGLDIVFLRRGIETLPSWMRSHPAAGVIVAFVVDELDAEFARLSAAGAPISLPIREEPWGERLFMVADPNGVQYELVEWLPSSVIPGR
jgi:catechol 2,3-dioxygenase-like lactoylglutathione lyase family enzyme